MKTTANPFVFVQGLCCSTRVWAILAFTRPWTPWPWQDYRDYALALPHLTLSETKEFADHLFIATFGTEAEMTAAYRECGKKGPPVRYALVNDEGKVVEEGSR